MHPLGWVGFLPPHCTLTPPSPPCSVLSVPLGSFFSLFLYLAGFKVFAHHQNLQSRVRPVPGRCQSRTGHHPEPSLRRAGRCSRSQRPLDALETRKRSSRQQNKSFPPWRSAGRAVPCLPSARPGGSSPSCPWPGRPSASSSAPATLQRVPGRQRGTGRAGRGRGVGEKGGFSVCWDFGSPTPPESRAGEGKAEINLVKGGSGISPLPARLLRRRPQRCPARGGHGSALSARFQLG